MNAIHAYRDVIIDLVRAAADDRHDTMERAATMIADVIEADGLVYVTGTGHAHMMAEEPFYRAGGLAAVHPILVPALMLHEGAVRSTQLERLPGLARAVLEDTSIGERDLLIVASNSGRNAFPVEAAIVAGERGASVIGLTSLSHGSRVSSRHPSGAMLHDVVDLVLDTGAPYGDASLSVGDDALAVGPVSTVLGAFIMNAVLARATQRLIERGVRPDVFASANLEGGTPMTDEQLARWRARVRPL